MDMDWPSLLVGALLGLATNLATPSVQRILNTLVTWFGTTLRTASQKQLLNQLKVLQEELKAIETLRDNPTKLIARIASDFLSLGLAMWLILAVGFFVFVHHDGTITIPKIWQGALGGALGASFRYVIAAISSCTIASQAAKFDEYAQKNRARQEHINLLISGKTNNPDVASK